ncbi:hypothetical protein CLV49_0523 [Labedella gwakjiensis]|uniref:Uncharacterized protein n=1 Tax=Labedella gwakjiensis TaxID=390269 RepID=A0A2P8GSI2_9MICO|nr:hypothetical protein [Labedella gwakjiensis]PSL36921.1 hypothetical protein CLV49_0523 [Labedella gwakjiensis]RUQ81771.1 hypothetical protein ELQ93_17895 [Labedella gwakjiensis]
MDWALTGGSWLAIVSLNAAVAGALGRSRLNWFIISIFLAPIASFLLMCFGRSEAHEHAHQRAIAELERERAAGLR